MTDYPMAPNLGYVQKPPILDNVIDYDGNVTNQIMRSSHQTEVGGSYRSGNNPSKVVTTTLNGRIETLLVM